MQFFLVCSAFLLVASFICTEAIFSAGVGITAGGLLAAAIGVKAIAGFGILLASKGGRRRGGKGHGKGKGRSRYGRSVATVEDIPALINEAALDDETDCAKKFICETHAKALDALDETEKAVYLLFGANDSIDVSRDSVQFDLAALVGRRGGNCNRVYARCELDSYQMKQAMSS